MCRSLNETTFLHRLPKLFVGYPFSPKEQLSNQAIGPELYEEQGAAGELFFLLVLAAFGYKTLLFS
jgi:hypothetical protein